MKHCCNFLLAHIRAVCYFVCKYYFPMVHSKFLHRSNVHKPEARKCLMPKLAYSSWDRPPSNVLLCTCKIISTSKFVFQKMWRHLLHPKMQIKGFILHNKIQNKGFTQYLRCNNNLRCVGPCTFAAVVIANPKQIVISHTPILLLVLELQFLNHKTDVIFHYLFWNFHSQIEKRKLIGQNKINCH